jgi:hypothetical protein
MFPSGPTSKLPSNEPRYGCELCSYPPDYRCLECKQAIHADEAPDVQVVKRINISSGEDAYHGD